MSDNIMPEVLKTIPVRGIRKIISERMRYSLDTAAQANHKIEIDMSNALALKNKLSEQKKISITPILLKMCAMALKDNQILNSALTEKGIEIYKQVHLSVAVSTDLGLVVPVLRNVDCLGLHDIDDQLKEIAQKARDMKLMPDDYAGGTFTVSNLGMYGIDHFTAIINPPQTGILALAATKKKPVYEEKDNSIQIKPIMVAGLTYDHRVVDGAPAAKFLTDFKNYMENVQDFHIES